MANIAQQLAKAFSVNPDSLELVSQLLGVAPCQKCGFVKQHCKCTTGEEMFNESDLLLIKQVEDGQLDYDELSSDLQSKLYDFFHDRMPYGTAKARTGDPDEWILNHLHEVFE